MNAKKPQWKPSKGTLWECVGFEQLKRINPEFANKLTKENGYEYEDDNYYYKLNADSMGRSVWRKLLIVRDHEDDRVWNHFWMRKVGR
jgi:hypothetical protein